MRATKIIIIHPGSLNLRIGRASDLNPVTILHAVAYKRRQIDGDWPYHDQMLPALDNINPMRLQIEFEEHRLSVSHVLQSSHVDESQRLRVATPPQQLAIFNRVSIPEKIPSPVGIDNKHWIDVNAETLYDKKLLRLSAFDVRQYDIHFPVRRGELNVHKGKGGSLMAVMSHLEHIWSYALVERLGIPLQDMSQYSAVLLINDIFKRSYLREFGNLLFRLGFKSFFMQQDTVAATFGAGLGYACVVDVGDQKTTISCVEDGISNPDTRVRLSYGGGDVTQVLLMMLRKCAFPYRECNVQDSFVDAKLMTELKERFCHLQANICGAHEKTFKLRKCNGQWLRFTLQVGDECIMAPMAFFNTELLNITGKTRPVLTHMPYHEQLDSEDCFDAAYLRETNRRNGGRDPHLEQNMPTPIVRDNGAGDYDFDCPNLHIIQANLREKNCSAFYGINGQVVSLDMAIIRSIDNCQNIEVKRKMFGCILLVGGSSKIPGFASWLENRISSRFTGVEVNVFIKDMDASMVSWKGAAIMSVLDSARELFITRIEWERCGLRVLREKAPFVW